MIHVSFNSSDPVVKKMRKVYNVWETGVVVLAKDEDLRINVWSVGLESTVYPWLSLDMEETSSKLGM